MKPLSLRLIAGLRPMLLSLAVTLAAPLAAQATMVRMYTTLGPIDIALMDGVVPTTVNNFLGYVNAKAYDGTFIHRAPKNFVVQGGGYAYPASGTIAHIPTNPPIVLEYSDARPNARGTISMARTSELNSATSEWFINTVDNTTNLGAGNGGGYAVFGKVTASGMVAADAIAALTLVNAGGAFATLPVLPSFKGGNVLRDDLVFINSAVTLPARTTDADRAFDYLEAVYWQYLKPSGAGVSGTADAFGVTYYYRYYPASNSYIGLSVKDNVLFYWVPAVGPDITRFDTLANVMPAVTAAGY